MAKVTATQLQISTPLFYEDTADLMGTIVKVLKRDVHLKLPDGSIRTNFPKKIAIKMIK